MIERFAAAGAPLVCPRCRGDLRESAAALACRRCEHSYPVVSDIPDLRVAPDRFLSMEADRAKGLAALQAAAGLGFEAALEAYWAMTPELDPALAAHHIRRQLDEVRVGRALLGELVRSGLSGEPRLDLGCGSGGLLAAAAERDGPTVGVDAAFRWLLIGRERLRGQGADALLVCANAEALPFPDAAFQSIAANDLLEHTIDPSKVAVEMARALHPQGALYAAGNNRYSLLPEPHVRLLGVGWLPRSRQAGYVRALRGHAYDKVRLLSRGELAAMLRDAGLDAKIRSAPIFTGHLHGGARLLAEASNRTPWPPGLAPRLAAVARRRLAVG